MLRVLVAISFASWCAVASGQGIDPSARVWIDRPWEYRYLLYTDTRFNWKRAHDLGAERRAADRDFGRFGESVRYRFEWDFVLDGMDPNQPTYDLAVLRLDINPDRSVVQRGLHGDKLFARLNELRYIGAGSVLHGGAPSIGHSILAQHMLDLSWRQ